ncbi:MAG: hypothetical protein FJZ96_10575 [Chloroflexi bacterium]|nr:hypothetical protein [Chloroflexota bacterium]
MTRKRMLVGILIVVVIAAIMVVIFAWRQIRAEQEGSSQSAEISAADIAASATVQSEAESWAGVCIYVQVIGGPYHESAKGPLWLYWFQGDELTQSASPVPAGVDGHSASMETAKSILCVYEDEQEIETCRYENTATTITRVTYDLTVFLIDNQNMGNPGIVSQTVFYGEDPPFCPGAVSENASSRTLYGAPSADVAEIMAWAKQFWSP